jgi:hypothetical protein
MEGFWPIFFLLVVLKIPGLRRALARLVGEQGARDRGQRGDWAASSATRPTPGPRRGRTEAAGPPPRPAAATGGQSRLRERRLRSRRIARR